MLRVVELQLSVAAKQHNIERLTKEVDAAKTRLQQTEQQLMSIAPSTTHTTDNIASIETLRSELYEARLRIKTLEADCEGMRKQLRRLQLSKDNLTDTVKKVICVCSFVQFDL
jgi:predicted  nucleic acid-binding Zn-ribbon protein